VRYQGAASERFEALLKRVFTVALLAISVEVLANFALQLPLLSVVVAVSAVGLLLASQLVLILSAWLGRARRVWFGLHSLLTMALLATWSLQVPDATVLPVGFQPWVWWALGMASLGSALAWPNIWSWLYIFANPALWLWVRLQPSAGPFDLADVLRDTSYLLLFPAVLAALMWALRTWVAGVDEANAQAITSAIERARVDAIERERQRLDALVHDQVLHTLLSAAHAENDQQRATAAALAVESIQQLQAIDSEVDPMATVSISGLFRSLRKAALRHNPEISVSLNASGPPALPKAAAEALTAATIQAIENAMQHANAAAIRLTMTATPTAVEISVSDNGKGFSIERISKNRIGLQTSIIRRVEAVGGQAQVQSKPGAGTTVKLRWAP
jgi:signal transduction histidine kinase